MRARRGLLVEGERDDAKDHDRQPQRDQRRHEDQRYKQDAAHVLGDVDVLGRRARGEQAAGLDSMARMYRRSGPLQLLCGCRRPFLDYVLGDLLGRLEPALPAVLDVPSTTGRSLGWRPGARAPMAAGSAPDSFCHAAESSIEVAIA